MESFYSSYSLVIWHFQEPASRKPQIGWQAFLRKLRIWPATSRLPKRMSRWSEGLSASRFDSSICWAMPLKGCHGPVQSNAAGVEILDCADVKLLPGCNFFRFPRQLPAGQAPMRPRKTKYCVPSIGRRIWRRKAWPRLW